MQDFRNLTVWEKAHALTLATYRETGQFPNQELFGLRLLMRRTASSIPMKIAQSCGLSIDAEVARCLQASLGAASELEYHYVLAQDLGYIASERYEFFVQEIIEVKKMLMSFWKTVRG